MLGLGNARAALAAVTFAPLMFAMLCAGCDSTSTSSQESAPGTPSASDCDRIAQVQAPAGEPTVLVVDNTASELGHTLPTGLLQKLTAVQAEGRPLVVVAVDGMSARVIRRVALDPNPGTDSPAADNARAIAVQCVDRWVRAQEALPTAPGSDVLDALNTAGRQKPKEILVSSDGLGNTGAFNLNDVGFDAAPQELSAALNGAKAIDPSLRNSSIAWYELGESARQLPQAARTSLRELWQALLKAAGATVVFETAVADSRPTPSGLPADEVRIPDVATVSDGCRTTITVPAALLFRPDSAELQSDADTVLAKVAAQLTGNPGWTGTIIGHTADFGTEAGRRTLSEQRAEAVRTALVGTGIDRSRLAARGVGSTEPVKPEIVAGRHDLAAAAANRRVVIEVGPAGCRP